jgi:ABC-type methionine transport system ATPase subunit
MNPEQRLWKLAGRLERGRDNLYLALEHLDARGTLKSVEYELIREGSHESFEFDQLSEGEKQLIAVIGAIRLTNQRHNLILLDEPDTHLNPQWLWEYPEMLDVAFDASQKDHSIVLLATHDPVVISGLVRKQLFLASGNGTGRSTFEHPIRHPRAQGVANLLCSSKFFDLPSSLDKKTQALMDEHLKLSLKETFTEEDKQRLREFNKKLELLQPGISERDPDYVAFLRSRYEGEGGSE